MGHFVLVEQLFVEDEPVVVVSSAHPRHVGFNDVASVRRPVLCVIWSGCDDAEKFCEHVRTFQSAGFTRANFVVQVSHYQVSAHPTYKVFASFREVIRGEIVVLCRRHRFLLQLHLPLISPSDFRVEGVSIASRIYASPVCAKG